MRGRTLLFAAAGVAAALALIAWGATSASAAQGGNSTEPSLPAEPRVGLRGKRVLLVGDSLAVGLSPRMRQRAGEAEALYGSNAEGGTTIGQWSKRRFEQAVATFQPDVILVSLGTNDAALYDASPVPQQVQTILDAAARHGARVYWIGPPTLPARLKNAEFVRQSIRATGVPYFESERVSFARSSDGIHAPQSGYATWADSVWTWLESVVP